MQVNVTVNGVEHAADVEPRLLLVHFIRDDLQMRGTHWGCDTSNCGACTVWVDDEPVKSCTMLAVQADGKSVSHGRGPRRRAASSTRSSRASWSATASSAATAPRG